MYLNVCVRLCVFIFPLTKTTVDESTETQRAPAMLSGLLPSSSLDQMFDSDSHEEVYTQDEKRLGQADGGNIPFLLIADRL